MLAAAFVLVLALVAVALGLSFRNSERFVEISRGALSSNVIQLTLEQTLGAVLDAETGQRGFLITSDSAYLTPYTLASQEIDSLQRELRRLSASQVARGGPPIAGLESIDTLIMRQRAELERTLSAYHVRGDSTALAIVRTGSGKAIMDTLRATIGSAEREERAIFDRASGEWQSGAARSFTALFSLAGVGLLLLATILVGASRITSERIVRERLLEAERSQLSRRVAERTAELDRERTVALDAAAEAEQSAEAAAQALARQIEAEAARKASEARFVAFVDQVQEYAIFSIDLEGRPTSWNAGVERVLGYSEPEFMQLAFEAIFTVEDIAREVPRGELEQAARSGSANDDRWMVRATGERFFANGVTTAVHDGNGTLVGYTKVMRNRTDHHIADEALRASETRYRLVARATREAIWDWDLATDRMQWNEGIATLFGYDRDGVPPTIEWWRQQIHPADEPRVTSAIDATVRGTDEFWSDEYRFRRSDGSYAIVTDQGVVDRDKAGVACRMIGTMGDITERREAEREARLFVRLVEASRDFIAIAEPDGRTMFVNDAGRTMVGLTADAIAGTTLLDFFPADQHARVRERVLPDVFSLGHWSGDIPFRQFDGGTEIAVDWNAFLIRDEQSGEPVAIAGVGRDLSERKRTEERLAQAQRMEAIGRLAGGVAHDLNNMLTTILGNAGFLQRDLVTNDPRQQDVAQIVEAAGRSATLTRSLLAFARRELIQPTVLDLNGVVATMSSMLRPALGDAIALDTRLSEAAEPVFADRSRLEQVLLNLTLNARDAMPRGGRLLIETGLVTVSGATRLASGLELVPGRYVTLSVSDTGVGMDDATRARIFEPFFTTKPAGEGTGLGLATVYGSVTQAGGGVAVDSAPGRGTTFRIYLPVAGAGHAPSEPARAVQPTTGGDETILVVEDQDAVRTLACRILNDAGYTCVSAGTGAEAVAILGRTEQPPELVLTDVVMPGMSGRELAALADSRFPGVNVLFMSGYTSDDVARRGLLESGQAFLQKPWSSQQLLTAVRATLDRRGGGRRA